MSYSSDLEPLRQLIYDQTSSPLSQSLYIDLINIIISYYFPPSKLYKSLPYDEQDFINKNLTLLHTVSRFISPTDNYKCFSLAFSNPCNSFKSLTEQVEVSTISRIYCKINFTYQGVFDVRKIIVYIASSTLGKYMLLSLQLDCHADVYYCDSLEDIYLYLAPALSYYNSYYTQLAQLINKEHSFIDSHDYGFRYLSLDFAFDSIKAGFVFDSIKAAYIIDFNHYQTRIITFIKDMSIKLGLDRLYGIIKLEVELVLLFRLIDGSWLVNHMLHCNDVIVKYNSLYEILHCNWWKWYYQFKNFQFYLGVELECHNK